MKRQLSNTMYGLNFAMEKNDFVRLKSSSGKKRNEFVANPILFITKYIMYHVITDPIKLPWPLHR